MAEFSETDIQNGADRMVRNEVNVCLSYMVSTLASGCGSVGQNVSDNANTLSELTDQAFELSTPIDDYEEPAYHHARYEMTRQELVEYLEGETGTACYDDENHHLLAECVSCDESTAREFCDRFSLDPHEREIFEHWAVSDWLGRQLEARGERVDFDFSGLTVWARTSSGQGISGDIVIREIWLSLQKKAA